MAARAQHRVERAAEESVDADGTHDPLPRRSLQARRAIERRGALGRGRRRYRLVDGDDAVDRRGEAGDPIEHDGAGRRTVAHQRSFHPSTTSAVRRRVSAASYGHGYGVVPATSPPADRRCPCRCSWRCWSACWCACCHVRRPIRSAKSVGGLDLGKMADSGDDDDSAVQEFGGPFGGLVARRRRSLADGDHHRHAAVAALPAPRSRRMRHLVADERRPLDAPMPARRRPRAVPAPGADEPGDEVRRARLDRAPGRVGRWRVERLPPVPRRARRQPSFR